MVGAPVEPPRSGLDDYHGGEGGGWVEAARARNDIEAHLLVGCLNEARIETRTVTDRTAPGAWLYAGSNPWAPVAILVRAFQAQDAQLVLAEIALARPLEPNAIGASRPRRWKTPVAWWAVALALGTLLSAISVFQTARSLSVCLDHRQCASAGASQR